MKAFLIALVVEALILCWYIDMVDNESGVDQDIDPEEDDVSDSLIFEVISAIFVFIDVAWISVLVYYQLYYLFSPCFSWYSYGCA